MKNKKHDVGPTHPVLLNQLELETFNPKYIKKVNVQYIPNIGFVAVVGYCKWRNYNFYGNTAEHKAQNVDVCSYPLVTWENKKWNYITSK